MARGVLPSNAVFGRRPGSPYDIELPHLSVTVHNITFSKSPFHIGSEPLRKRVSREMILNDDGNVDTTCILDRRKLQGDLKKMKSMILGRDLVANRVSISLGE